MMSTLPFIPTRQLLDTPIGRQRIDASLMRFAKRQGIETPRELLQYSLQELLAAPGFTTKCYDALIDYLERNQRLYLLRITNQA